MKYFKFQKWLEQKGVEILPTTNEYESLRFKGREVGVIYKSGRVSNSYTKAAITAYKENLPWNGAPIKVGRHKGYKKEKAVLLERDGTKCFMCEKEMGEDITLEHLVPISAGGKNTYSNMVLMHEKCNQELSNSPLYIKIKLIISCILKAREITKL